jgi:sigma-B regulation protein RsbU (phosphoserine phosphatase)
MIYKSLLHASLAGCRTPGKLLELINEKFLQTSTVDGFYLTASIVRFNPHERTGLYASAGHPPAMTFHRNNGGYVLKEVLDNHAFMIGIVDGLTCTEQQFALEPGEFMILASDGIFEADGPDGKPMGRQGIIDFFAEYTGHLPAQDLFGRLLRASPYGELADDASIVCVGPLA